jgi:hypothetical protein
MRLDVDCLREAKLENLERLARSLGVRLPDRAGRSYSRRLVRAVLKRLDEEQRSGSGRRAFFASFNP